jgi:hypothetical protein
VHNHKPEYDKLLKDNVGKLSFVALLLTVTAAMFYVSPTKEDINKQKECRVALDDTIDVVAAWDLVKKSLNDSSLPGAHLSDDQLKVEHDMFIKKADLATQKCSRSSSQ